MKTRHSFVMRLALLALILCMVPAALAESQVTMNDIMAANTLSDILRSDGSVAIHETGSAGSETAIYADKEIRYTARRSGKRPAEGDMEILATADHCLVYSYIRGQEGVYPLPILMLDAGLTDTDTYYNPAGGTTDFLYDTKATSCEKILSVEEKDGRLVVVTRLDYEDYSRFVDGVEKGSWNRVEYVLEKKTYRMLSQTETVMAENDVPRGKSSKQEAYYGLKRPEDADNMLETLDRILNAQDVRTVTYIVKPGTPSERVVTVTAAKGCPVLLASGNLDYDLFTDSAMTIPAEQDDLMQDRTLYVRVEGDDEVAL